MTEPHAGQQVYRHSITARVTHWLWALAMLVLFMSGLQIFNAAPYLDASDKSDPARRVLSFEAHQAADGNRQPATDRPEHADKDAGGHHRIDQAQRQIDR